MKLRNEMLRMAECLGEEMASELERGSRRHVQDLGMERRKESHRGGEILAEQSGYDELEGGERGKGEGRMAKGSSSESDESSERWRWDGRAWW